MAGILWIIYERFIWFRRPSISDNKKGIYRAHIRLKAEALSRRAARYFLRRPSVDNHFIATPVRTFDDRIIYQFEKWREIECSRNVYNAFSVCPRGRFPSRSDVHFSKRPLGRGSKKVSPEYKIKNKYIVTSFTKCYVFGRWQRKKILDVRTGPVSRNAGV